MTWNQSALSPSTNAVDGGAGWCGQTSTMKTPAPHGCPSRDVMHFVTLWPWPLTFWPHIHWWARTYDGLTLWQVLWLSFSPFRFYRADRQTHWITESHTYADDRYTHATLVSVSNNPSFTLFGFVGNVSPKTHHHIFDVARGGWKCRTWYRRTWQWHWRQISQMSRQWRIWLWRAKIEGLENDFMSRNSVISNVVSTEQSPSCKWFLVQKLLETWVEPHSCLFDRVQQIAVL